MVLFRTNIKNDHHNVEQPSLEPELEQNMIRVVTMAPASMLQEMLCEQINRTPGFLLTGKASDPGDLPAPVAETQADVVICVSKDSQQVPETCRRLLAQFPKVVVVSVMPDDDTAVLFRQEISRRDLPSVGFRHLLSEIRQACGGKAVLGRSSARVFARPAYGFVSHPMRFSLN